MTYTMGCFMAIVELCLSTNKFIVFQVVNLWEAREIIRGSYHGYSRYSDEEMISNIYFISYSKLLSMQAVQIKASTLYMYTFHGLHSWTSNAGVSIQI